MAGFEYLPRPFPYAREPFLVASGEKIGFEGRFFSVPAYAAQVDKRLFTVSTSHPVANVFKLYINKTSNTTISTEPSVNASGYERGTPHYSDVLIDIRSVLESAFAGHAADSDYTAQDFKVAHLNRQHEPYNLTNSSRPDVIPGDYVHKNPTTSVPSGNELGATGFHDIDIDELQWQPFARPKNIATINGVPYEPIFPVVIKTDGSFPDMSTLDEELFSLRGLGISTSGGFLVTGDRLLNDTSIKLLDGSGAPILNEGSFKESVPWALYPAQNKLNIYYPTENSGVITASGRQAIFNNVTSPGSEGVYLLNVSEAGTSGSLVQNWPSNYHSTSGIDINGKAHNGVHVTNKAIYNLYEGSTGNLTTGRSTINGKKIFAHHVGTEVNSQGKNYGQAGVKYVNGNTVYGWGGITVPRIGDSSEVSWLITNKTFSPINWTTFNTTVWQPRPAFGGNPASTTWTLGDINASSSRIVTYKQYAQWGYIDKVVSPDNNMATAGIKRNETIRYETHVYREGVDPNTGLFGWVELPPPQSPTITNQSITFYENTYDVFNIFSFFFLRKRNYGMVHANGDIGVQWSDLFNGVPVKPICNRISMFGQATTKLTPATTYSQSISTIGFFPNWSRRLSVTTNNQVIIPDQINISSASVDFSFSSEIPMSPSMVDTFGPVVWDPEAGVNYLYFNTIGFPTRYFFAKMNTSFVITHINEVSSTDAILSGRAAILSI